MAATIYGWAVFASTFHHPGSIGFNYIAPGSDWMVIYGATRLAIVHKLSLTFDSQGFTNYINQSFAHWLPQWMFYRPWVYPPSFLIILLPFAMLGFATSYAIFQLATAMLLAASLLYRAQDTRSAPWVALAALACPAASINAVDGQCSFLVAGLLVCGFRLVDRRPLLAGMILGLISVKPQFGLMVPVALLALRQWRAIAGATLSVLGLAAASAAAFGSQTWLWWINRAAFSYGTPASEWATFERVWGNSVYACAALVGASPAVSLAMQILAGLLAAGFVLIAYRSTLNPDLRLAVLLGATVLAAPHLSTYDMVLPAAGGALWFAKTVSGETEHAPNIKGAILVLALWMLPLLGPPGLTPAVRAEPLLIIGFLMLVLYEMRRPLSLAWQRGSIA